MAESHIVTFHKCGSNWFRRLFRDAARRNGQNIWVARPNSVSINQPVDIGAADTMCLYRTVGFDAVQERSAEGDPVLLCVRDPKDVLISQYWSWRATHLNNDEEIEQTRVRLQEMSLEDGLLLLLREQRMWFCNALETWLPEIEAGRVTLVRYEDLLRNFEAALAPALELAGLPLTRRQLLTVKEKYSFRAVTNRDRGDEDRGDHYRKGIAGDWKNYSSEPLAEAFNAAYGHAASVLGYEPA